jgi:acetate kinase
MPDRKIEQILTINTGSSSLKISLYSLGREEGCLLSGTVDRIGFGEGRLRLDDAQGAHLIDERGTFTDHGKALESLLAWPAKHRPDLRADAVGHRVVHGGPEYREPQRVTPELLGVLKKLVALAPEHMPQAIQTMETAVKAFPGLVQVACFDTAFHRQMPRLAQIYPLPRKFIEEGLIRYGFHGLSYEYIMQELRVVAPQEAAGRVIIAHLGNGASMAAVRAGTGIDTTMGFTPCGGLMMGTRLGDVDPGVLLYLLTRHGLTPAALSDVVNRQSGLGGVSGTSADMRDLLAKESTDPAAAEAVALFCRQARKHLAALAASLGGLNTLVFTGGIGEHATIIRQRIAEGLEFLGIRIDGNRNEKHAPIISPDGSPVTVRVMSTREDLMIARHTRDLAQKA